MIDKSPLSVGEYAKLLLPFKDILGHKPIAVMVSGGADSLALLWLTQQWVQHTKNSCIAVSINHHLRAESTQEMQFVGTLAQQWGVEHVVLNWEGTKPVLGIQAKARQARYQLIDRWCGTKNIQNVLLGHHLEDQIETFISRLCHHSTYYGLTGMAGVRYQASSVLLRPLLSVSKNRLRATLEHAKIAWKEDPSNTNEEFERVRIRLFLSTLCDKQQFIEKIQSLMGKCSVLRTLIDQKTADFFNQPGIIDPWGYIKIPLTVLNSLPWIEVERILNYGVRFIGGQKKFFRSRALKEIWCFLKNTSGQKTYGGCILQSKKNYLWLFFETRGSKLQSCVLEQNFKETCIQWDHRFYLTFTKEHLKLEGQKFLVKPLGLSGWCSLAKETKKKLLEKAPLQALFTLPVIWNKDKIVALPNAACQKNSCEIIFNPLQITF